MTSPATSTGASPALVADLGTIVGVWAHPDDEAYLSGGLMALARAQEQRVVCVTATRGELGTSDNRAWPAALLAATRTEEMAESLRGLGVEEHHWLDYPDGGCAAVPRTEAVDRLCAVLEAVRPDTVVTFGPDGITGHPDHVTVGAWAVDAVRRSAPSARLLGAAVPERRLRRWAEVDSELGVYEPGFPRAVPDHLLAVDLLLAADVLDRKVAALRAQRTQTAALIRVLGAEQYRAWVSEESFAPLAGDSS